MERTLYKNGLSKGRIFFKSIEQGENKKNSNEEIDNRDEEYKKCVSDGEKYTSRNKESKFG